MIDFKALKDKFIHKYFDVIEYDEDGHEIKSDQPIEQEAPSKDET